VLTIVRDVIFLTEKEIHSSIKKRTQKTF